MSCETNHLGCFQMSHDAAEVTTEINTKTGSLLVNGEPRKQQQLGGDGTAMRLQKWNLY